MGIALLAAAVFLTAPASAGVLGEAGAQAPSPNRHLVDYTPVDYEPAEPRPPAAAPAVPLPRNRFSVRRVKRIRANGRAIVFVRVFAPGRVFVWGRGIRTIARGTAQPRVVRVPIKPKSRMRSWLRRKGKARIRVKIAFRPFGGIAREPRGRTILLRKRRR